MVNRARVSWTELICPAMNFSTTSKEVNITTAMAMAHHENELYNSLTKEVTTAQIGEMVMDKLKVRDHVAYVRFASVYREFTDVEHFLSELMELKSVEKKENDGE